MKKLLLIPLLIVGCEDDESEFSFSDMPKQITVFGIKVVAKENVPDAKVIHAANVLAQYLDNDSDGSADNQDVVDKLVTENATLIMMNSEEDMESFDWDSVPENVGAQDLFGFETHPDFNPDEAYEPFDATLEEVLHLISQKGYAEVYPNIFGEVIGSSIANAMDVARGGQFTNVPSDYPPNAFYTYDDESCDYGCMVTEYFYWSLTSILGAQKNRGSLISWEWQLYTKTLVMEKDASVYSLLTDPEYNLPVILLDGNYTGFSISLN